MSVSTRLWTLDEVVREWGYDLPFEVIDGELREVMSPSSDDPSRVGLLVGGYLMQSNEEDRLGEVFGADGGFILSRTPLVLVAPDVAFVRAERIPPGFDFQGFFPGVPDLAAEVVSPSDRQADVDDKIARYLAAGTRLVWKIEPVLRLVEVHRLGRPPQTLHLGDVLDGEDVLPGFRLPVASIFREPYRSTAAT